MDIVATALASAAVDPRLAGVLFVDADPVRLREYATWYAGLFEPAPAVVTADAATTDDHLWTRLGTESGGPRIEPGPLFDHVVVVVPDLARLSRAAAHTAIATVGADVIHVERDGVQARAVPRARWLAGCRRADLPLLSRHLLDRFPVIVDVGDTTPPQPPPGWLAAIRAPAARPEIDAAGIERIVCHRHDGGVRRDLALARLARAVATLDGASAVSGGHVDVAARVLASASAGPGPRSAASPWSETTVVSARDVLRGSGRTHDWPSAGPRPRDLAITASIVEALRHQRRRCPGHFEQSHPVHVAAVDLRRHRRDRRATEQFVLLLDHTCRGDWDPAPAIGPYVRWANETRADIHVVEVGAAGAGTGLAASHFAARNPLDRRFHDALDRDPGRATPLAHGLDLAARLLRDRVRRGRAATGEAVFVLVTDGRGDVPIAASRTGTIEPPVGRRGVADTLTVAERIRALNRVRTVVAAPPRAAGGTLIASLATALDAPIVGVGAHG